MSLPRTAIRGSPVTFDLIKLLQTKTLDTDFRRYDDKDERKQYVKKFIQR